MMQRWADLLDEWEKAASEGTHAEIAAMQPKAGGGSA
jgi:hypothetical protein